MLSHLRSAGLDDPPAGASRRFVDVGKGRTPVEHNLPTALLAVFASVASGPDRAVPHIAPSEVYLSNLSNGNLERKVKGQFRYQCKARNARCAYCKQQIDYSAPANSPLSFEAAHRLSVKTHPHLAYNPTNFVPSHSKCNRKAQDEPFTEITWVEANWG